MIETTFVFNPKKGKERRVTKQISTVPRADEEVYLADEGEIYRVVDVSHSIGMQQTVFVFLEEV